MKPTPPPPPPPYDARIEYLESSGTQWLNTGILPTSQFKIECDAMWDRSSDLGNPYPTLFGSRVQNPLTMFELMREGDTNRIHYQYGSSSQTGNAEPGIRELFTIVNNILYINGVAAITAPVATFAIQYPLALYALNLGGSAERFTKARIYRFKVWDADGILVRDYIPVRIGTTGYMYDQVSGQLFGNAGTAEFILGPDL